MSSIADEATFNRVVLARLNSGRNDKIGDIYSLKTFLAEVDPPNYTQNFITGQVTPTVSGAKAATYGYFIKNGRNEDIDESMYALMEEKMMDAVLEYNSKT